MKTASVSDIRARLTEYLAEATHGPVLILEGNRPIAALIAISDAEEAERLTMALSPELGSLLDTRAEEIRQGGALSHEEFWRLVDERYCSAAETPADEA
jgi:prevent-host-death family protein